jgi:sugar O-acyltransferase (sialic acid O-acetyltransferase NeuD family)
MQRYAVYGASGFGREVMPLLRQQLAGLDARDWDLVFLDDHPVVAEVNGQRVLRYEDWLREPAASRRVTIGIGDGRVRERIAARCEADGVGFVEVRAANVVVMDAVTIGPGSILSPFVTVTSNARIGRHFQANLYSYVAHDCVVGDFVTFAPAVRCNGNVTVEDHAYVGTGAILRQGKPGAPLVIGRGAVVGMGAVVTRSVPPGVTVVGNPARPMADRT